MKISFKHFMLVALVFAAMPTLAATQLRNSKTLSIFELDPNNPVTLKKLTDLEQLDRPSFLKQLDQVHYSLINFQVSPEGLKNNQLREREIEALMNLAFRANLWDDMGDSDAYFYNVYELAYREDIKKALVSMKASNDKLVRYKAYRLEKSLIDVESGYRSQDDGRDVQPTGKMMKKTVSNKKEKND